MNKSVRQLEQQADDSRQALQRDVQALRWKLKPRRMAADAVEQAKTRSLRIANRTGATVKANPIPFAVAGGAMLAGAGWWLARSLKARRSAAD